MKRDTVILFYPIAAKNEKSWYIPYPILHLERAIRHLNLNVILIDENATADYLPIIEPVKDRILMAGVSSVTGYQIHGGIEFSERMKSFSKDIIVIWGGWHTTFLAEQTIREEFIDIVMVGQSEMTFPILLERIIEGKSYDDIKGIGCKNNGQIKINPNDDFCDIKHLPRVNYKLIDLNNYIYKTDFSNRRLMYMTSWGCPNKCPFCSGAAVFKGRWYPGIIENVIEDLKYFKEHADIDSILMWDDNFFSNRDYPYKFFQAVLDAKLDLKFDTSSHSGSFLRLFKDEDVAFFYKAGLRKLGTGTESGRQEILDIVKDRLTVNDNLNLVKMMKRHNVLTFWATMIGLPIGDGDDIEDTFNMIRKGKLIDRRLKVHITYYTPFPGTPLYQMAIDKGFKPFSRLKEWADHSLFYFRPNWTKKDYEEELHNFMNFYLPVFDPDTYIFCPPTFKSTLWYFSKLWFPVLYLRFRFNFFNWAFDARLFFKLLGKHNKKQNTHLMFFAFGINGA
ncbi:MAG: radical SAM protein [Bacteroidales bacterium]|nr:radical SAM protein [Bacteroidales bacterium]